MLARIRMLVPFQKRLAHNIFSKAATNLLTPEKVRHAVDYIL
jgi:hypothetical protein